MMAADSGATILENKDDSPKMPDKKKTKFDIVIIGAGPSGYTAGIYCSRAGYDTLILSGILPGGQLVNTTEVENYPGFEKGIMGPDLMIEMRKQTQRMGTTIIDDEVVDVDFRHKPFKVLTASEEYEGRAVIIATGANPNKIKFHWNYEVTDIKGDQKMRQAVLKNIKTGEEKTLDVAGLFVAIGHEPNTKLFKKQIDLDDEGYIVLKNKTHTNIEGVFAAGDVHDRNYRQAVTAAGFGCMAAIDVDKYLTENS